MQELINKRTKHSKTYDLGNGQQRVIIQKGQHYLNPATNSFNDFDGNWELDNTVDNQGKIFGHKIKKADHNLRIYHKNNNKILKFGFNKGNFIEYTFPNIEPIYSSNQATFAEAWINTDIQLTVSPEGIKNDIILKSVGHPSSFSFPIRFTGCNLIQNGNKVEFYDKNDTLLGSIPEPFMLDANDNKGLVILTYNGSDVVFTPDISFLSTATYPVTIDPTTVLQPDDIMGQDAFVGSGSSSDSNFGAYVYISVANRFTVNKAYIQFQLPSDFVGSTVNSTVLALNCSAESNTPDETIHFKNITSAWDENTITFNNAPAIGTYVSANYTISGTGWKNFDISALGSQWAGGLANHGVMLESIDGSNTSADNFYSSEYSDSTVRPKLTLDYTPTGGGTNVTITSVIATSISQTINPIISITTPNVIINSIISTSNAESINPIIKTGSTIQSTLALSQSAMSSSVISGDCNINQIIATSISNLNNPSLSTSNNLQVSTINSTSNSINPTITANKSINIPSIISTSNSQTINPTISTSKTVNINSIISNSNGSFISPTINVPMNINLNAPSINSISNMINPRLNSFEIVINFDTMRLIKKRIYVNFDTKRNIKSSQIIRFDTLRKVQNSKIYTTLFDTKRIVKKSIQVNNDTLRQVVKSITINFDTSRKLAIFKAITYTFDAYFTRSKSFTAKFTTKLNKDIKFTLKKTINAIFKGRWK